MGTTNERTSIVRRARRGQFTIPAEFRHQLNIGDDTLLRVTVDDGELRVRPVEVDQESEETDWFRGLYDYFAPARAEAEEKGYTDEQINEWIDEAVREVRAERAACARKD